jgi:uncharacterized protein YmfQ (DUF2313 family)
MFVMDRHFPKNETKLLRRNMKNVGITQAFIKTYQKRNQTSCFEWLNKYDEIGGNNMRMKVIKAWV